ncbi:flavin reductase family protein [Arthrobacter sp. TS-15]|uniref:flavin reductase family protein n=1 Tax=Arthrobacter sp. TS-15 TaxID=2510797 RepID=UPI001EE95BF9|nr:flavin reductase family protein [Arthrobacter sp. TS-15]
MMFWKEEFLEWESQATVLTAKEARPAPHRPVEAMQLRRTLGNFATGVTVVTYADSGAFRGATVNSFTSVSLEPPLVLVSLMRTAKAAQSLQDRAFTVNILNETQLQTALQFAGKPQDDHHIDWVTDDGVPRINDSLAYFTCDPWRMYDGGDHLLVLGKVRAFGQQDGIDPLLFYRGAWGALAPHPSLATTTG